MELMSLNEKTIKELNLHQNSLIKYMLNMNKFAKISDVNEALKIYNLKHLFYKKDLNFLLHLIKHHG